MKISELTNKSFLNNAGAAANSYVLINYEDNSTSAPVTYKTSLDTLGKAIAKNLNLMHGNTSTLSQTDTSQSTYTSKSVDGWNKLDRAKILAYDPSLGKVNYYRDDFLTPAWEIYEQTTIGNKDIVVNTSDGIAIKNGNSYDPITKTGSRPILVYDDVSNFLYYYDNTAEDFIQATVFANPTQGNVIYDSTNSNFKYYDEDESAYIAISGGSGGVSHANPEDGFVYFDASENSGSGALMYYSAGSEAYMELPVGDVQIKATADSMPGPSEAYHLVYQQLGASVCPLYAVADPWRIPGDSNHEYNLVVCNANGSLFKVVAPSDSDPSVEALTT